MIRMREPKDAFCDTGFRLIALVGAYLIITGEGETRRYASEWRGHFRHCRVCQPSVRHLAERGWLGLNVNVLARERQSS